MKKLVLTGALLLATTGAQAQGTGSNPNGYPYTSAGPAGAGVYIQPHQQTNSSGTQRDHNKSTTGSVNSNTGGVATRNPR